MNANDGFPQAPMTALGRVETLADGSSSCREGRTPQSGHEPPLTVTFHLQVDGAQLC